MAAETLSEFIDQQVVEVNGEVFDDPDYLAEDFVVYTHTDIGEVMRPNRQALEAIDLYFRYRHPLMEYKPYFLIESFLPALGAYLGRIAVRDLNAEWDVKKPIMHSTLVINGNHYSPFEFTYNAIHAQKPLIAFYDLLAAHKD